MDKYIDFINEGKDEYANNRIKVLVNRLLPLLNEAKEIYPRVRKYKRVTTLTNDLKASIDKIIPKKESIVIRKPVTAEPSKPGFYPRFFIGDKYTYVPDRRSLSNFSQYGGKSVTLIDVFKNNLQRSSRYCECLSDHECIYLVEAFAHNRAISFWTRPETLKKNNNIN